MMKKELTVMNYTRYHPIITRITSRSTWKDLNLPPARMQVLHDIAVLARQKRKPGDDGGFPATTSRGLGISALFDGQSGTGKGVAAEAIARELNLDLYRIDLAQVVSRDIGETEKNLRLVFDAAEEGGAILYFDEADALFGKRSKVKDSHDRYTCIELEYLLGRMENFRGLAILSAPRQDPPDPAFTRRFRFVVGFPEPGSVCRNATFRKTKLVIPGDGWQACCERAKTDSLPAFERNEYFTGKLMTAGDVFGEQGNPGTGREKTPGAFERTRYFTGKLMTVRDFRTEQGYDHGRRAETVWVVPGSVTIACGFLCIAPPRRCRACCCRNAGCPRIFRAKTFRACCSFKDKRCMALTIAIECADPAAFKKILQLKGLISVRGAGNHYDGTYGVESISHGIRDGQWTVMTDLVGSGMSERHYSVDQETGEIQFGDAEEGKVPEPGTGTYAGCYHVGSESGDDPPSGC